MMTCHLPCTQEDIHINQLTENEQDSMDKKSLYWGSWGLCPCRFADQDPISPESSCKPGDWVKTVWITRGYQDIGSHTAAVFIYLQSEFPASLSDTFCLLIPFPKKPSMKCYLDWTHVVGVCFHVSADTLALDIVQSLQLCWCWIKFTVNHLRWQPC